MGSVTFGTFRKVLTCQTLALPMKGVCEAGHAHESRCGGLHEITAPGRVAGLQRRVTKLTSLRVTKVTDQTQVQGELRAMVP
jgi:hypothetical protein